MRALIGLSGFCIGLPVIAGWCKWRLWEWQANRGD